MSPIKSFKDLEVYQISYELVLQVHSITKDFPCEEKYELGRQLRRAAVSIPANIAEGYGKRDSVVEFKRFLRMATGSCNEVLVYLDMIKDFGYISDDMHRELQKKYDMLGRRMYTLAMKWQDFGR